MLRLDSVDDGCDGASDADVGRKRSLTPMLLSSVCVCVNGSDRGRADSDESECDVCSSGDVCVLFVCVILLVCVLFVCVVR